MSEMDAGPRALFERAVRRLDEGAEKRLRLARRATLASAPAASRWQAWAGASAAAAALVLGLAWWWPRVPPVPAAATPAPVAATPADAGAEEPVLAEADEDAELYAWLAETPVAAEPPEHQL